MNALFFPLKMYGFNFFLLRFSCYTRAPTVFCHVCPHIMIYAEKFTCYSTDLRSLYTE